MRIAPAVAAFALALAAALGGCATGTEASTRGLGAFTVSVPAADYRATTTTDSGDVDNALTETDTGPHHIAITTENGAIELRNGD